MEFDPTYMYGAMGAVATAVAGVGVRVQLSHSELVGRMKAMAEDTKDTMEETDAAKAVLVLITDVNGRLAEAQKKDGENITKLLTMHEHPDDYEFGTTRTNQTIDKVAIEVRTTGDLVRDSTAASREATKELKELTGLLRLSLQQTGKPMPDPSGQSAWLSDQLTKKG